MTDAEYEAAFNDGYEEAKEGYVAEVERLQAVETAALALWAVVRRTDEHHAWLEPMGKLGAALEHKP